MDKLLLLKKQLLQGANPNKQLLLEELLMDWCAIIRAANQIDPMSSILAWVFF